MVVTRSSASRAKGSTSSCDATVEEEAGQRDRAGDKSAEGSKPTPQRGSTKGTSHSRSRSDSSGDLFSKEQGPRKRSQPGAKDDQKDSHHGSSPPSRKRHKLSPPSPHSPPPSPPHSATPDSLPPGALRKLHALISPLQHNRTICPSQLGRALYTSEPAWRAAMPPVRALVWECVRRRWVEVTQGGEVRSWEGRGEVRGPIRVRKGERWGDFDVGADFGTGEAEVEDGEG